ncbi:MAG: NADH-quinone oxidoreductase subunit NuoE [Bacteroidales bacterium]|jgi:NADH-quinone oxidoreductase subunit E|nr:NADH-quinone oxidoreductase subunit NuoE [Bacteroidales bacterium]MCK9448532.1 NADH-quinone oxidoreductase subunit NuoE [Bacteroidales bacterium]MDD3700007.1 NADH-quinone oxidoreductase subunit NuoE [Bacteroidales bacterium]MDY0368779.1 NADH-quinone oxidoreductase subunit NuoE [Bacteroidales bacterium]
MKSTVQEILQEYPQAQRDSLIPILQHVQEKIGFLSEEAVIEVGKHLHIPASKIFGVATFYNQFRFSQPGKYHIQVCRGTACHVLGSATVLDEIEKHLKIKANQTTRDRLFSLEVVACIGACGLAPVISINGEFHAKVTTESIKTIFDDYRNREDKP